MFEGKIDMTDKGTRLYSISEMKALLLEKKEIPEELEALYSDKQKFVKRWFERYVVLENVDDTIEEPDDIGELLNIDFTVEVDEDEIEVWVDEE